MNDQADGYEALKREAERFVLRTLGVSADDIVALAEDLLGVAA